MASNDVSDAGAAAARGTLLGFLLRILSFFLTQLTVRFVDPVTLGRASIRLELLLSTSLFLGREGFRLALTTAKANEPGVDTAGPGGRSKETTEKERVNNVAWLSIPIGLTASVVALVLHLRWCEKTASSLSSPEASSANEDHPDFYTEQSLRDFRLAGIMYCLAAVIEMTAEPIVITCMKTLDVDSRAKAEGSAAVAKAATLVFLLSDSTRSFVSGLGFDRASEALASWPVSAFGISQMVYALIMVSVLFKRKWRSVQWLRCTTAIGSSIVSQNFDLGTLKMVAIFTIQSMFKHVLTEGDRIVLMTLSGSYDQGVYAMASSYGGMASRLLLQPLEENARLLFARQNSLLSSVANNSDRSGGDNTENKHQQEVALKHLESLRSTYATIVRLVLYIGFLFACVASNYTSVLLRVLAGPRWGSNPDACAALSAFCLYTALLALNGTTEAFVYGVASQGGEVGELSFVHATVGGMFAVAAPLMVAEWGTVGLVSANCAAMAIRSLYSIYFAARYFCRHYTRYGSEQNSVRMGNILHWVTPHPAVLFGYVVAYIATRLSFVRLIRDEDRMGLAAGLSMGWIVIAMKHISTGVLSAALLLVLAFRFEKKFGQSLKGMMVRDKKD